MPMAAPARAQARRWRAPERLPPERRTILPERVARPRAAAARRSLRVTAAAPVRPERVPAPAAPVAQSKRFLPARVADLSPSSTRLLRWSQEQEPAQVLPRGAAARELLVPAQGFAPRGRMPRVWQRCATRASVLALLGKPSAVVLQSVLAPAFPQPVSVRQALRPARVALVAAEPARVLALPVSQMLRPVLPAVRCPRASRLAARSTSAEPARRLVARQSARARQ